jgi:putative protein kinase ArgK-like GTPase of G3E family
VQEAIDICKAAAFDFIILESAGVGQSDASILDYCDVSHVRDDAGIWSCFAIRKNQYAGLCRC